jgi:hypothetical protein
LENVQKGVSRPGAGNPGWGGILRKWAFRRDIPQGCFVLTSL